MTTATTMAAARLWAAGLDAGDLHWSQLPPLPDPLGVAGPFAGMSGGALLVAGGANLPKPCVAGPTPAPVVGFFDWLRVTAKPQPSFAK